MGDDCSDRRKSESEVLKERAMSHLRTRKNPVKWKIFFKTPKSRRNKVVSSLGEEGVLQMKLQTEK